MFRKPTAIDSFRFAFEYHEQIYGSPNLWRNEQMRRAQELLDAGHIDAGQFFEMQEEVVGAYSHAVERTQLDQLRELGIYQVVDASNGAVVGHLKRMYLAAMQHPYLDGLKALHDKEGQLRMLRDRRTDQGPVNGLSWDRNEGGQYRFRLIAHYLLGVEVPLIVDLDHYRVLQLLHVQLIEGGETERAALVKQRLAWAMVTKCPDCLDRGELREDCATCNYRGLVGGD